MDVFLYNNFSFGELVGTSTETFGVGWNDT